MVWAPPPAAACKFAPSSKAAELSFAPTDRISINSSARHLGLRRCRRPSAQGGKAHKGLLLTGFCCLFTRSRIGCCLSDTRLLKTLLSPGRFGWAHCLLRNCSRARAYRPAASRHTAGDTIRIRREKKSHIVYVCAPAGEGGCDTMSPPQWGVDDTWRTLSSVLEISVNTECVYIEGYLENADRLAPLIGPLSQKWRVNVLTSEKVSLYKKCHKEGHKTPEIWECSSV